MPFIGGYNLQNVRSNFQRQTKKKIFASPFQTSEVCKNKKGHFCSWNRNLSSVFRLWNIDVFIARLASSSEKEVLKLVYKLFFTINERHIRKSIECLPSILQPNHLLNQYFKRHYIPYVRVMRHGLSNIFMFKASWFSDINSTGTCIGEFGRRVSQIATVSNCIEKKMTFVERQWRRP